MEALQAASRAAAGDEKKVKGIEEYFDIYQDLRERFELMMVVILEDVRKVGDIEDGGGEAQLLAMSVRGGAIKIFRKMVVDCLTGVQQTLSTYGVQHDRFDFESELGWEGSNDKVLEIMKNSDYYVPQTQCNDKGVPQGAYLDMSGFIADQGLKTGKGSTRRHPLLYVLCPDGSTLYTYRDIVYSFKKAASSDLILNIICSEQELAQQKVSLGMMMMNPEMKGRQYHLSYDLVKLTTGKMSGRRGRYLLADDLYDDLKAVIREKMAAKFKEKGEDVSPELFEQVTHEVSTAAMKYAYSPWGASHRSTSTSPRSPTSRMRQRPSSCTTPRASPLSCASSRPRSAMESSPRPVARGVRHRAAQRRERVEILMEYVPCRSRP